MLDALEQAIQERRLAHRGRLVRHSDRGSQYVSIRYSERLAEAGIESLVGSIGDSYDDALAETINGPYNAEVIHSRVPWRSLDAVENATLEWGDWFNNRRLLEPFGNNRLPKPKLNIMLPRTTLIWQRDSQPSASGRPGAVQMAIESSSNQPAKLSMQKSLKAPC